MESHQTKLHILVVDDNIVDRRVMERMLQVSSFQVTIADSGMKALEVLSSSNNSSSKMSKVDMILTDYCMPAMTGYDLLKRVKESTDLKEIPVVIISSDENKSNRIKMCIEEGAEDFLFKPLKRSDISKLRDLLVRGQPPVHQTPREKMKIASD